MEPENNLPAPIEYYKKNYVSLSAWAKMAIEYWTNESLNYFKEKIYESIEIFSRKLRNCLDPNDRKEYREQISKYEDILKRISDKISTILHT